MLCSHHPRHLWPLLPPRHTSDPGSACCPPDPEPSLRAGPQPHQPQRLTAGLCLSSAGLHIYPCWISSGACWSILPTRSGTSERQPYLPPYQLLAPNLLSCPKLMKVPSIYSFVMLNRTDPMTDHCRTTLGTDLQVGYDTLTMTFWARPFFPLVFYPWSCPPIQIVTS